MKHSTPLLVLLTLSLVFCVNSSSEKIDSDNNPIVDKGWLKYVAVPISGESSSLPQRFEKNLLWINQDDEIKQDQQAKSDQYGFLNIPDDSHFFFVLTKKTLFVLSGRRNDMQHTHKSLEISWLEPVINQSDGSYSGGLEDIGNFKEGFCFKLRSTTGIAWDLCADSLNDKSKWIAAFKELMQSTTVQSTKGAESSQIPVTIPADFPFTYGGSKSESTETDSLIPKNPAAKVDGRWVVLKQWSECTLACGGGKSFMQRMCYPPLNGGKPCSGQAIMDKPCNEQACPTVLQQSTTATMELPPQIKIGRISNRPQRYEACIVKEGDLDIRVPMNGNDALKFPVRTVLNNRTITVFATTQYESIYKSFDLKTIIFKDSSIDQKTCFVLIDSRDQAKTVELCIMAASLAEGESVKDAKNHWIDDINFFKNKCQDKVEFIDTELSDVQQKKRMDIELENDDEKAQKIEEQDFQEVQAKQQNKVDATSKLAMNAVEKELKYEQLALKEELMNEKDEESKLDDTIQDEKDKECQLEIEHKKKSRVADQQRQTVEADQKVKSIKQQAVIQVQTSRSGTREKIDAMRKAAERRRRQKKEQIIEIRTKIATQLFNENKDGSAATCSTQKNEVDKNLYCTSTFKADPQKQADCMTPSQFCQVCCEQEFGEAFMSERGECIAACDAANYAQKLQDNAEGKGKDKDKNGNWAFIPQANKIGGSILPPANDRTFN